MLKKLTLKNVGSFSKLDMAFEKRLNIITGNNGTGKSFLLNIIWYALTRTWTEKINCSLISGYMARPSNPRKTAVISFQIESKGQEVEYRASFSRSKQSWIGKSGRPYSETLILYVRSDGGFSIWDSARNYWSKRGNIDIQDRLPAFVFSSNEIWDGLKIRSGDSFKSTVACNGLIYDLASWQKDRQCREFQIMRDFLSKLSPPDLLLDLGELTRISLDDVRDIPTVKTSSGNVPILFASSGIRRIFSFAYCLTWALCEHIKVCKLLGRETAHHLTVLFDDLETHLHPDWQTVILNSMLNVLQTIFSLETMKKNKIDIQIFVSTHSPLILSSFESVFQPDSDLLINLVR